MRVAREMLSILSCAVDIDVGVGVDEVHDSHFQEASLRCATNSSLASIYMKSVLDKTSCKRPRQTIH